MNQILLWLLTATFVHQSRVDGQLCNQDIMIILDTSSSTSGKAAYDLGQELAVKIDIEGTGHRVAGFNWGAEGKKKKWCEAGPDKQGNLVTNVNLGYYKTNKQWVRFIEAQRSQSGNTPMGWGWQCSYNMFAAAKKREQGFLTDFFPGSTSATIVFFVSDGLVNGDADQDSLSDEFSAKFKNTPNLNLRCVMLEEPNKRGLENMIRWCGEENVIKPTDGTPRSAEEAVAAYLDSSLACFRPTTTTLQADPITRPPTTRRRTTRRATTTTTTPTKTTKRLTTTTERVSGCELDLLLVIDFSGSVIDEYTKFKSMAGDLVGGLDVGEYTTRVAMLKYSSPGYVENEFQFNSHFDKEDIIRDIKDAVSSGGWTDTAGALDVATDLLNEKNAYKYGFRTLDKTAGRVIVVFSDGYSQTEPAESARKVRSLKKLELMATGTDYDYSNWYAGKGTIKVNETQLIQIAGDRNNVYINDKEFKNLIKAIKSKYNRNCK